MKSYPQTMALLMLATAGSADAASVMVDWLVAQPGGTPAAFTMLDDGGGAAVGGVLALTRGMAFPGLPMSRRFAAGEWSSPPEVIDSVTGVADLGAMEFRVVPSAGSATYRVDFRVPANQALVIAVGGLLRNGNSATGSVIIGAASDLGSVPVTLRSANAWSNGLTRLNQGVDWNPLTQALSTAAGADGDSEFVLFEVAPLAGENPRLSFAIPDGYGAGSGDSIFIGLGVVVPEPATAVLLLLGAAIGAGRRRRRLNG